MSDLDCIIREGMVIDGTGAEGYVADIGIAQGRIVEIGKISSAAPRIIEAEGQVVTPGFIDGHTHMDAQVNWDPIGRNSCWHGVTTVVMGNCGFSVAPMRSGQQKLVARNLERAEDISGAAMEAGMDWQWEGFDEYLDVVDALPKGINYSAYIGHSALRTWAMGERAFEETASSDDLDAMRGELRRALDAGAIGFSTSRSFAHETSDDRPVASRIASRNEVQSLVAEMKGRRNAVFELAQEIHAPGTPESDDYYRWLRELTIESGVTTTFGVIGKTWKSAMAEIEETIRAGGRMVAQTHSRGVTILSSFRSSLPFDRLPVWSEFRQLPLEAQMAGLRDAETRSKLIEAVEAGDYGRVVGAEAPPPKWNEYYLYDSPMPPWRNLAEVAAERGVRPIEVLLDTAQKTNLEALFMQPIAVASEEDTLAAMRHPSSVMTFSDSGAHVSQIADSSIQSHLIAYFCREKQMMTLPEAIELMTRRPARAWGFEDRGVLRQGNVADINIFDPETFGPAMPEIVHDLPTGARRISQRSKGIKATMVAGEVFIENGEHTGALPGRLIRRADA